jgi:hypothetical protein
MSRSTSALRIIIGLAILGSCLAFFLYAFIWFANYFADLQKEVTASIVAASATALVSIGTLLTARAVERQKQREELARAKRIPVYEEFLAVIFRFFLQGGATPSNQEELKQAMGNFTQKMMVWGSSEVVAKWSRWRRLLANQGENPNPENLFVFEEIVLAIRKDIGYSNKDLARGDVLGLFVNDIDTVMGSTAPDRR